MPKKTKAAQKMPFTFVEGKCDNLRISRIWRNTAEGVHNVSGRQVTLQHMYFIKIPFVRFHRSEGRVRNDKDPGIIYDKEVRRFILHRDGMYTGRKVSKIFPQNSEI